MQKDFCNKIGHNLIHTVQQNRPFIRSPRRRERAASANGNAERLCGLEVDDQLDFGGLLDRRISGLLTLENAGGIAAIRCPRRRLDLRSRQVDRGSLRRNQDSAAASNDFATCHEVAPETHRWRSIISKSVQSDNSIDLWLAPQKLSRLSATR